MKKSLLFLLLLPLLGATCFAQESRQDFSLSYTGLFEPFASGNAVQLHSTVGKYGVLGSYRYDLTPHGALELNYQYNQNMLHYVIPTNPNVTVHTRFQEFSGAYVRSFTFRNWNPFLEAGIAGVMMGAIDDRKTSDTDASKNTAIGGLYGGGIAYEISPSFDIRAEYRGLVVKTPTFNFPNNDLRSNVYYNISAPSIGI